jgi:hypothetical protein
MIVQMEREIIDEVLEWSPHPVADGYAGLHELADGQFSGAVTDGDAWAFVLNGRVVGVFDGTIEAFEDAELDAYTAPDKALPLLYTMRQRGGTTRAKYYTNETPLSEVDRTLSEGGFTGYVELSENVLSGDYYVVYYGGRSMSVAFIGNNRRLVTGDEAFDRADDEVGIYAVREAKIDVVDLPERPEPKSDADESSTGAGAVTIDADEGGETETAPTDEGPDGTAPTDEGPDGTAPTDEGPDGTAPTDEGPDGTTPTDEGPDGTAPTDAPGVADGPLSSMEPASVGATESSEGPGPEATADSTADAASTPDPESADGADATADGDARADAEPSDEEAFDGEALDEETPDEDAADEDEPDASEPVTGADAVEDVDADETDTEDADADAGEVASPGAATVPDADAADDPDVEPLGRSDRDAASRPGEVPAGRSAADAASTAADPGGRRREPTQRAERLQRRVDELESEVERLESDAAERRTLPPTEALAGTNLFVRYESKSAGTLQGVHEGQTTRETVNENLVLDYHTDVDTEGLYVDGDPYETFLHGSVRYEFARWLVTDLFYEIRDTGSRRVLDRLYDAIPEIDRVEFSATVEGAGEESFDVVCYDRMGNPLIVADVNDSRDPTTRAMMQSLVERATAVTETAETLAAAFFVTTSYYGPDAMEVAAETTGGGLFSRTKRKSYVKISRKRGFHLCLAEARENGFYLTVPDL